MDFFGRRRRRKIRRILKNTNTPRFQLSRTKNATKEGKKEYLKKTSIVFCVFDSRRNVP